MHPIGGKLLLLATICAASIGLSAQSFKLFDRTVQVHGFASQGFAYSNDNNYLTMNTSSGSGALTDGGVNASMSLTDRFRIGGQVYVRNIGQLGKGHVDLDWAYADYRFKSWLGVRGGKVKTALGLYNDTQDSESLFTWAILPQAVYPLDLRSTAIAHTGGDVYGRISLHEAGSLNYTAYIGKRTFDTRGGYYYFSADNGFPISTVSGRMAGVDVRWAAPLSGLTLGGSWADMTQDRRGIFTGPPFPNALYTMKTDPQRTTAAYVDFERGHWHLSSEYRASDQYLDIRTVGGFPPFKWNGCEKGWFGSLAYRVSKRLELGAYNSRYYVDQPFFSTNPAADHIFDQAVTGRFDIDRYWDFKIEGHFMDGFGDVTSAHGFYTRSNPNGMKPKTNMLVLRTGFHF